MKKTTRFYTLFLILALLALFAVACSAAGDGEADSLSATLIASLGGADEAAAEAETPTVEDTSISEAAPASDTVESETVVETPAETAEVESDPADSTAAAPVTEAAMPLGELEAKLIDLYKRVNPAVVHIFVFEEDFPIGTGSGFVYDSAGHIVTNNHVIENGDRYEVVFPGGERSVATRVGTDVDSDLGVLQVEVLPADAKPLPLGNSRDIQVGQFVIAIGNPFGQESSMSLGIISGVGRSLASQRIAEGGGRYSLPQVIQTDAPINPGNSGGPLLNLEGKVVGVNAAIRSQTASNSGVGFSIPVNAVSRIVPALIESGSYTYPFLGISADDNIDLGRQEALGLTQTKGVYVITAPADGPAGKAGIVGSGGNNLPGGDLIVEIDGVPVNEFGDLISYLVFETEVGQTVNITVLRDGEQLTFPVKLGARP